MQFVLNISVYVNISKLVPLLCLMQILLLKSLYKQPYLQMTCLSYSDYELAFVARLHFAWLCQYYQETSL